MVGKKDCPFNIKPVHWERLEEYWSKPETKKKVEQMSNVRSQVMNLVNVG
jgi:hypothetical protein